MQRGVDGMRVDALEQLFEAEDLRDEPRSNLPGIPPVGICGKKAGQRKLEHRKER